MHVALHLIPTCLHFVASCKTCGFFSFLNWLHLFLLAFQNQYSDSKLYPMFPRYNLLKDMIKEVTHHPDYMEHRHESRVQPD